MLPLVAPEDAPPLARPFYANGDPGPIVAALAHVPEVLELAMPFLGVILGPSSVSFRRKEIVILRTSARLRCRFCINAHTVVASDAGLTATEIHALLADGPVRDGVFAGDELAVVRWVDRVASTEPVDAHERDAVAGSMAPHELVEVTLLVGATMMLNRFCTALDLPTAAPTPR